MNRNADRLLYFFNFITMPGNIFMCPENFEHPAHFAYNYSALNNGLNVFGQFSWSTSSKQRYMCINPKGC